MGCDDTRDEKTKTSYDSVTNEEVLLRWRESSAGRFVAVGCVDTVSGGYEEQRAQDDLRE